MNALRDRIRAFEVPAGVVAVLSLLLALASASDADARALPPPTGKALHYVVDTGSLEPLEHRR